MAKALKSVSTRRTPQREAADSTQIKNAAGGYVFQTSPEMQFHRFLTLGVTGPTYYVGEHELARDALALVRAYVEQNGVSAVQQIVNVSLAGRAPKQDPALFALAVASVHGDIETRRAAYDALPQVARTASALFTFASYRTQFGGWSRGYRSAVSNWYLSKSVDQMTYQMVKYRNREGFTHRRLLQTAHPKPDSDIRNAVFRWALDMPPYGAKFPSILVDFMTAQESTTPRDWVEVIDREHGLSWEMLPTQALTVPEVWEALIYQGIPINALIRQLPRLTNLGLVRGQTGTVIRQLLTNQEILSRGRIHPINVLAQLRTYSGGQGKGQSWTPDAKIIDALDQAFYLAFKGVEPSNKRLCLALDVSGSMSRSNMNNMGGLTPREASAALSLVQMTVENEYEIIGFTGNEHEIIGFTGGGGRPSNNWLAEATRLALSPRQRLDDAVATIRRLPFGPTDCALPMLWALENKVEIDTFVVYTDNQTWAGRIHPHQALKQYRDTTGINAKMIVVAMTPPLNHTIADPRDPGMLDVVGFDSAVPNLITDFARGSVG